MNEKNPPETPWLKDPPSLSLQQSLKDPERAYKNVFRERAAFPQFKKREQNEAFRYPQRVPLVQESCHIFLPEPGWIHDRNSRHATGMVKNVTLRPAVRGTSVFRQKVKYQLRFTLQHQGAGWTLAWLNPPRCQMAQSLRL